MNFTAHCKFTLLKVRRWKPGCSKTKERRKLLFQILLMKFSKWHDLSVQCRSPARWLPATQQGRLAEANGVVSLHLRIAVFRVPAQPTELSWVPGSECTSSTTWVVLQRGPNHHKGQVRRQGRNGDRLVPCPVTWCQVWWGHTRPQYHWYPLINMTIEACQRILSIA